MSDSGEEHDIVGQPQVAAGAAGKKKKRNKKKKAPAGAAAAAAPSASAAAPATSNAPVDQGKLSEKELLKLAGMEWSDDRPIRSDPIAWTLVQVCRRGHEPKVVREVLDEMWSSGLAYDDPDAVTEHLLLRWGGGSAASPPRPSEGSGTTNGHSNAAAPASAPAPITAPPPPTAKDTTPLPSPPTAPAPAPAAAAAVPLEARLEQAASVTPVSDALAAISAWASMVEPSKMGALLNSRAMELLFANFLAQTAADVEASTSALRALLERVLPIMAPPSSGIGSIGSGFHGQVSHPGAFTVTNHAVRAAARLEGLGYGGGGGGGGGAVAAVARRLAAAVREHHSAAEGAAAAPALLREAQAAAARNSATLARPNRAAAGGGTETVRELFTRREQSHEAALALERACALALHVSPPDTSAPGTGSSQGGGSDAALLDALLADARPGSAAAAAAAALGSSGAALTSEGMRQGRGELEAARERLRALHAESERQAAPLEAEAEILAGQATGLAERRRVLLEEVARVEAAERDARARSAALAAAAAEARAGVAAAAAASERQHAGLAEALGHVAACEGVVRVLADLEAALRGILQGAGTAAGSGIGALEDAATLRHGVGAYLSALESYLASEGECVALLRRRVTAAEEKVQSMSREMAQYQAMGLSKNVADLSATAARLRADAEEDNEAVAQLLQQATAAAGSLAAMLRSGGSNGSEGGVEVWNEHAASLGAVLRHLRVLGIAEDWDLSHLGVTAAMVAPPATLPPPPATLPAAIGSDGNELFAADVVAAPPAAQLAGKQAAPRGPPPSQQQHNSGANVVKVRGGVVVPRFEQASGPMPVLSWARAAPAAPKKFIDIQREETAGAPGLPPPEPPTAVTFGEAVADDGGYAEYKTNSG